jgi:hypothetical protein
MFKRILIPTFLMALMILLALSPTTVVKFRDGSTVTLPPLPQTLTWMRQRSGPAFCDSHGREIRSFAGVNAI